jgi:hypothetical protein
VAELDGIVVHVGMNKSGSTWLQRHLFPRVRDRTFVGRGRHTDAELSGALRSMARPGFRPGSVRRILVDRAASSRLPLLVSDEIVLSTLLHQDEKMLEGCLEHLHREVPEATILLVVRRPADLVRSSHSQYVKRGGTAGRARFCSGEPVPGYRFNGASYDVGWIHEQLAARYGPDRVRTAAYEQMTADPDRFVRSVLEALGNDPAGWRRARQRIDRRSNPSLTRTGTEVLRRFNRVAVRSQYNPGPLVAVTEPPAPYRRVLRFEQRVGLHRSAAAERRPRRERALLDELHARYASSCAALAARTGLPLGDLNYF